MTVQTFNPSDLSQSATNWSVAQRVVGSFAPHAQALPNMTVVLDQGSIFNGGSLTEVDPQVVGPFSLPADIRVDRVVIDNASGVASIVTGTNGSLTPPAIPAGSLPVARVTLTSQTSEITNAIIVDERVLFNVSDNGVQQVKFRAHRNGTGQSVPTGTWTKVALTHTTFNVGAGFDTTNQRFSPTVAGYYQINANVAFTGIVSGSFVGARIYKNGSAFLQSATPISNGTNNPGSSISDVIYLDGSTDYLEMYCYQLNGSNATLYGEEWITVFSGALLA